VRRAYSICSAEQSGELRIAVKRVEEGDFSNYACDNFVTGQMIDVMPPHGRFTAPLADPGVHYVGCAAGSGITPILSIMKSVLAADAQSRFSLFYGNRTVQDSLFHDELKELAASFGDRLHVIRSFSKQVAEMPDHTGRIDAVLPDLIEKHIGDRMAATQWFICGPNPMMRAVKEILLRNPIQPAAILMESFVERRRQRQAFWAGAGIPPRRRNDCGRRDRGRSRAAVFLPDRRVRDV
jgi:ring-1,2-phenylacetyl-CoA epoxidase subunit PaaE